MRYEKDGEKKRRKKERSRVAKHQGKIDEMVETGYNAVLKVIGGDNKEHEDGSVDSRHAKE